MGEATQVSSLPLPPMQYVGLYTDENVQRGRAPSPPRPLHEGYSMFGAPFHGDEPVIRPLESQGIRRLYPQNYEHKKELKKLNHSLLVNFLDMVDILIRCPDTSKRLEKKDDMSLLFIHMHHLINEYRPHQARETLRVMLDMQRRQRLDTAHRFHKHLDKLGPLGVCHAGCARIQYAKSYRTQ
ncbi:mediator of RNA polymerase II transcription subunit 7-like isoform X3 [Dermacentor variabilis]|uniref:mediator of RNA polymerase II transcription subunit 7-like isoform X3 n=1 Tax=Dermacentor variabilis TaxID=34621 RepID=UPI003F5B874C